MFTKIDDWLIHSMFTKKVQRELTIVLKVFTGIVTGYAIGLDRSDQSVLTQVHYKHRNKTLNRPFWHHVDLFY